MAKTKKRAAVTLPGRKSLYRGKLRAVPVTVTLTPRHHTAVRKATARLGLSRSDLFGLLIERYADTVEKPDEQGDA